MEMDSDIKESGYESGPLGANSGACQRTHVVDPKLRPKSVLEVYVNLAMAKSYLSFASSRHSDLVTIGTGGKMCMLSVTHRWQLVITTP